MTRPEEIAQWIVNNRHNPNVTDAEMFNRIFELLSSITPTGHRLCEYAFYCKNKVRFSDYNYCIILPSDTGTAYCPASSKEINAPQW